MIIWWCIYIIIHIFYSNSARFPSHLLLVTLSLNSLSSILLYSSISTTTHHSSLLLISSLTLSLTIYKFICLLLNAKANHSLLSLSIYSPCYNLCIGLLLVSFNLLNLVTYLDLHLVHFTSNLFIFCSYFLKFLYNFLLRSILLHFGYFLTLGNYH